jgi:hypothetical protein
MSLQDLPPELTERVVDFLRLSDICSLRLTSRSLAVKIVQTRLKASFRRKSIELTEEGLRSFVAITGSVSGDLGCLLQDLTLIAPVYNFLTLTTDLEKNGRLVADLTSLHDGFPIIPNGGLSREQLRQTRLDLAVLKERLAEQIDFWRRRRDVELLRQAFSNLDAYGASLHVLRIEVVVYTVDTTTPLLPIFGGIEKPIWDSAAHSSHALFASLANCDLPIHSLNLFNTSRMVRCSIPLGELNRVDFASIRLGLSLNHLTELSLRVSDRHVDGRIYKGLQKTTQDNFDGLRSLLRTCPGIQKLDLAHFSRVLVGKEKKQHGRLLRALDESDLRYLHCLTLQGLDLTEHELLTTLQGFGTLRSLSLRYISLKEGSFTPIFDYCTVVSSMERLELDSLSHKVDLSGVFEHRIIRFEPPWVVWSRCYPLYDDEIPEYPDSRASYRRASDTSTDHRIEHQFFHDVLDAPYIRSWDQDMRNRFGPFRGQRGKPSCLQSNVRPEHTWRYYDVGKTRRGP